MNERFVKEAILKDRKIEALNNNSLAVFKLENLLKANKGEFLLEKINNDYLFVFDYLTYNYDVSQKPRLGEDCKFNILLNTSNQQKVKEIECYFQSNKFGKRIAKYFEFSNLSSELEKIIKCKEDQKTFSSIAKEKSLETGKYSTLYSELSCKIILSDDSGITINNLPNDLNTKSKRFSLLNKDYVESYFTFLKNFLDINTLTEMKNNYDNNSYHHSFNNQVLYWKMYNLLPSNEDTEIRTLIMNKILAYQTTALDLYVPKGNLHINENGYLFGEINQEPLHYLDSIFINKENKELQLDYYSKFVVSTSCVFGFNNIFSINYENKNTKISELPLVNAMAINNRQEALTNTFIKFFETLFA